jgi:hypothetical protein
VRPLSIPSSTASLPLHPQAWATLEERQGNLVRARKLFDAATAAERSHAAAWHGWGMLEQVRGFAATSRFSATGGRGSLGYRSHCPRSYC